MKSLSGLPNVKEFRANFGSFGGTLLKDGKSRIFAGNGTVAEGGISSLSFFVQSLWLQQKPVVYHLPEWLDFMSDPRNYYSTRLAFLFTGIFQPSLEEIRRQERFSMLEMAEGMAEVCLYALIDSLFFKKTFSSVCGVKGLMRPSMI
jgi:hypothetical protein